MRTFWKFYGNVGNWMLNRLEALPVASGTSFAAETGPEGQKSLFLDWKHLLVKIWSILENGNSEKFRLSHRGYFSWTLRTGPGESDNWRLRERGIRPRASAKGSLGEPCATRISSFGDCDFSAVCTPDVHRAMCGAGAGA